MMKKLFWMLLLSSVSMQGLEAAAGQATDEECKVDDLRDGFLHLSLNAAAARAAGVPVGAPLPATLLDKSMAPRFGAVAIRSVTGRLPKSVRERFLHEERVASAAKLGELGLLYNDGEFTLTTEADVERAERVIDRLPRVFRLKVQTRVVERFAASPLMQRVAPGLEELELRWCGLREVPAWVAGMAALKKLILAGNPWITIADDFVFPPGLEELEVWACGLRSVPAGIAALAGLRKLVLSSNGPITIPQNFVFPAGLEELYLSDDNLREVPAWVAGMAGLKKLNLWGNRGITIPASLQARVDAGEIEIIL